MHSKKTQKHLGQQQLDGVTPYEEQTETEGQRLPIGMPILSVLKTYTTQLGLPDSDAEHLYDSWLVSGFRTKAGPIRSWRAAVRLWHRSGFFPSQKKQTPKPGELMTYEILDDIAKWTAFKKLDVHREGAEFKEWCEKNDRPKLVSSFIKRLNAKL